MFFCKLIDLFLIVDLISHKSLDFVDEVGQLSAIDSMNLSDQKILTINETTNKTTVSKSISAKPIDKLSPIRK